MKMNGNTLNLRHLTITYTYNCLLITICDVEINFRKNCKQTKILIFCQEKNSPQKN